MKKGSIRIGTENLVDRTNLLKLNAFDLLFDRYHEFVHIPDYYPWLLVNGSWTGALGQLMNDNRGWIGIYPNILLGP